ncbi:MAG TPA: class I adenylate-forming enzyme family protein [Acidimicrobiales bacterium]|nr:class I adenylate-forming enzyme family protein [Acidimicrobiales bacterium]
MQLPELDHLPTMPAVTRRAAELYGDADFIVTPERRMSFSALERASRVVAGRLLATGVGKGTRVGAMYGYGPEWLVAFVAITRIGAVYMPFSTAYKPAELRRALRLGDVERLLIPPELNGSDHTAFVEEAVPGLAGAGPEPLFRAELPYLRSVWVTGPTDRSWARRLSLDFAGPGEPALPADLLDQVESEVTPADWLITVFTSGTTATPKAVTHTHGNFLRHGANLGRFIGFDRDTRSFCGMPFFWIGGCGLALNMALAGGSTILCCEERFSPEAALDLMEAEQANHIGMWAQLRQRLNQYVAATGRDTSRIPALAGPPVEDPELRHNSLGMTETVGPHSAPGPEVDRALPEEMRGSFGLLVPHVEHRIADPATGAALPEGEVGQVCIRGYSLMTGLYKKERHEAFDDDGWYATGDRGWIKDGYLYFSGRLSEMIKTAGSNVAPREVELTLESFPEVGLAVVLGLPDEERGEIVAAAVVPKPGAHVDPVDLLQRADKELSSYKLPRRVLVLEEAELPQLASGKADRLRLRDMLSRSGVDVAPKRG